MVHILTPPFDRESIEIRRSRLMVFCKNGVLRDFAKFTGKHLCKSLFFNKVAGLRPATLLNLICIKWLPGDPSTIFLATIFTSKNARKLRFHVFLHFSTRTHMILSFYLKWTEFIRNCEFVPI